ncbi:hypothetical protein ICG_06111 [Bacillus cereus BAG1X1-3]|nr:hypothetical protein ICG_06111 [Bacillus cereus BAG1X1-3]
MKEIGKCDFCNSDSRYLKELLDNFGEPIMAECFYGCDDPRSIPNEKKETIEILSINKTDCTLWYDSKWKIETLIEGNYKAFQIIRYFNQNEEELINVLANCNNQNDILRLNKYVFNN